MWKLYIAGVISVRSTHLWGKGRIRTSYNWIRIREAQQHADPADPVPDPQHWRIVSFFKKNLICFVLGIDHPTAGDRRFRSGNRGSHAALCVHWRSGEPWRGIVCILCGFKDAGLWLSHTIHLVWSQDSVLHCTYSGSIWSTLFYSALTEAMSGLAL